MEREKDNIIIITDGDGTAPEAVETPDSSDKSDTAITENESGAEVKKRTAPDFFRSAAERIRGAALKAAERVKSLPSDLTPKFIKIACAVSAAVIIAAAMTAFFIPKSDGAAERSLNLLRASSGAYNEAKTAHDNALAENRQLGEELRAKNEELEEFRGAQGGLDKISESNAELEKKRDELAKQAEQKQNEYDSLSDASGETSGRIVTLPSGYYTVGKDITAGSYTVTGSGSIAVARGGKSTANKLLTSDGEAFELKDDDRVQIDGSAKFIPR